jgi:hypothetical protein
MQSVFCDDRERDDMDAFQKVQVQHKKWWKRDQNRPQQETQWILISDTHKKCPELPPSMPKKDALWFKKQVIEIIKLNLSF